MSAIQEAKDYLGLWGKELSKDLETSLVAALKSGGSRSPQQPALNFSEKAYIDGPGVSLEIIASGKYWDYINSGVSGSKVKHNTEYSYKDKKPPASIFGEKWQKTNGIDPRAVLLNIKARAKKGLNYKERKFKKLKKTLDYKKSVKSFSFIVQESVFKKGLKPKPFVDRVLEDGRIEVLSSKLLEILGEGFRLEIITELNGSN